MMLHARTSISKSPLHNGAGAGVGERGHAALQLQGGHAPTYPPPAGGGTCCSSISGEIECFQDAQNDTLSIGQDIIVPEADDGVAMRFDKARAICVSRIVCMLSAINLDYKFCPAAGEINDKRYNRELACELYAHLPGLQFRPKSPFRIGRFTPQFLRNRRQWLFRHMPQTHTQTSPSWERTNLAKSA